MEPLERRANYAICSATPLGVTVESFSEILLAIAIGVCGCHYDLFRMWLSGV